MSYGVVLILIFVSHLRKKYQTAQTMPGVNRELQFFLMGAVLVMISGFAIQPLKPFSGWMDIILLAAFTRYVYTHKSFDTDRNLIVALVPLLIVSVVLNSVKTISLSFYNEYKSWFEAASSFAMLWAIGTWLITRKQQKELIKARQKAKEEEENSRVALSMKEQLEVQVAERTSELRQQKEELELALNELKATQAQLIHSEKMASLGELTAGIAHEIQNPLNFVNNFSEVNNELTEELKTELAAGNLQLASEIVEDIKSNSEKINYHGKRAGAIVKGMLQHSRKSEGKKELTDINALCDEYLRLSYHGLRAKDKSFNAKFETELDPTLPQVNVLAQDLGRVILNLINNAFYAVNEKVKSEKSKVNRENGHELPPMSYEPTVTIKTNRLSDKIEISVSDNGNGISDTIKEKIFQPFFTTKPSGEGTGLGLSLSYDIITKGHGGTLKVNSEQGQGTTFVISLPLNQ